MKVLFLFANFFDTKDEGWHFYHDTEETKEFKPKNLKELKEKAQEFLEIAIWNPSSKNVLQYQRLQKQIIDKSQLFANIWTSSLLKNPFLDHTIQSPTSYYGALSKRNEEEKENQIKMQKIAKNFGLVLLIKDDNASRQLQNIVESLSNHRNFQLMVINAQYQPDLINEWDVKRLPALLMFNIISGKKLTVTYGLLSMDKIEEQMIKNMEASL